MACQSVPNNNSYNTILSSIYPPITPSCSHSPPSLPSSLFLINLSSLLTSPYPPHPPCYLTHSPLHTIGSHRLMLPCFSFISIIHSAYTHTLYTTQPPDVSMCIFLFSTLHFSGSIDTCIATTLDTHNDCLFIIYNYLCPLCVFGLYLFCLLLLQ